MWGSSVCEKENKNGFKRLPWGSGGEKQGTEWEKILQCNQQWDHKELQNRKKKAKINK